jgi:hypothetical protein
MTAMPGRATDLLVIDRSFWDRSDVTDALRGRDVGRLFRLLAQYAGASQTRLAIACQTTQPKVSGYMRGTALVEALEVFERIADGLAMPDRARIALGLAPNVLPVGGDMPSRNINPVLHATTASSPVGSYAGDSEEDELPVRRRTFVGLTGASLASAILADTASGGWADVIESFATVLVSGAPDTDASGLGASPDVPSLAAAVAQAKRDYQACRYTAAAKSLPTLISQSHAACAMLDGQARCQAFTLSAEAHHVAASVMLKAGDQGLGWLAADRSMRAAQDSEDPVTIASSARIITHALMKGKHYKAATDTASTLAVSFGHDMPTDDPVSLSVYGSLLLRGATAAAQHNDRRRAYELLREAEGAAGRVGGDHNLRWTAFGPTNASLHRVNIALTLGDAGTAIDVARTVDLSKIDVTERKASFLMDTARAFLQCGRYERAYLALRAAAEMAPEEITGRPLAQRLVRDLVTTAPPSVQRQASEFACRVGVTV